MPVTRRSSSEKSPEKIQNDKEENAVAMDVDSNSSKEQQKEIGATQEMVERFLNVLTSQDQLGVLQEVTGSDLSIDVIRSRRYMSLNDFKRDLYRLFDAIMPITPERRQALERLRTRALSTLEFEADRLKRTLGLEAFGSTENALEAKRLALFRPALDGYIFSDSAVDNQTVDKRETLPYGVQELAIYPTLGSQEAPTLKQTVPPPSRFPSRARRYEERHTNPIQWLDYGPYSSFAPTRDSNNANVSYESTYMGRASKRFQKWEKKQRNQQTKSDVDTAWLKENGLDSDAIMRALEVDIPAADMNNADDILQKNKELLEYLIQYQDYRFGLGDARWGNVDDSEREIAKTIESRIKKLISTVPPKFLIDSDAVEATMERYPVCEGTYRGTLPTSKMFAYHTSDKVEPLPPIATMIPNYAKEKWKFIDVAPKDENHPRPLLHQQPILAPPQAYPQWPQFPVPPHPQQPHPPFPQPSNG